MVECNAILKETVECRECNFCTAVSPVNGSCFAISMTCCLGMLLYRFSFSQREHASLWDYLCNKHIFLPKENISSLVGHLTPLEPGCVASLEFQGVTLHTARVTAQVWLLQLLPGEDKISPTQLPGVHPISSSALCVFIRVPSWTDLKSHWSQWESNVLIA